MEQAVIAVATALALVSLGGGLYELRIWSALDFIPKALALSEPSLRVSLNRLRARGRAAAFCACRSIS